MKNVCDEKCGGATTDVGMLAHQQTRGVSGYAPPKTFCILDPLKMLLVYNYVNYSRWFQLLRGGNSPCLNTRVRRQQLQAHYPRSTYGREATLVQEENTQDAVSFNKNVWRKMSSAACTLSRHHLQQRRQS